jgi:orotate phosphoribosyltransferase
MKGDIDSALQDVICRHLYHRGEGGSFGIDRQFRSEYFIDLMEAVHVDADLRILVSALGQIVRDTADGHLIDLAGPKYGNGVLVHQTANYLGRSSALIRDEPLFYDRWIQGCLMPGVPVLLVDDVFSDGDLLAGPVETLRRHGHSVSTAICLVNRIEGNAAEVLGDVGVKVVSLLELGDSDLLALDRSSRTGATHPEP